MSIAVKCRCGKKFKAKDRFAGRTVRCPNCNGPLQIPASVVGGESATAPAPTAASPGAPERISKEEALLRFERAQKDRQVSAEAEAAYVAERNKLIASYDQLAGKKVTAKKKKEDLTGKPRKPTIFTKIADLFASICGTLAFKYVFVMVLLSGGVVGSIYLVKFVANYMQQEGGPSKPTDELVEDYFKKAEDAVKTKRWGAARDALNDIIQMQPRWEKHPRYQNLKKQVEKGFENG
jgi:hypothetical protein